MNQNYEEILKRALTPTDEPKNWLNQNILYRIKEADNVKKRKIKRIPATVLTAVLVLGLSSMTVYAAWNYLMPEQVVEEMQDENLADAFAGEDAIFVNETQSYGGYDVTFLGIVSGKQLSEGARFSNGKIHEDRSHVVVAIENADGTPMPDTSEDAYGELQFYVSPYIKGYNPMDYNAHTLVGNYTDIVEEGVLYRLLECDNVEIFADCGLYLGVQDGTSYEAEAYHYEEITGELTRNESYAGLNALFSLPIDPSKADPEAVSVYIENLKSEASNESIDINAEPIIPEDVDVEEWMAVQEWIEELTSENVDEVAECVESTVQVLTPDEEGYIESAGYEIEGRGGSMGCKLLTEGVFPDTTAGKTILWTICGTDSFDSIRIETYTMNEDGTYTFAVYIPKVQ